MAHDADSEDHGQVLLAQISDAMVGAQKQFFGTGPTEAKSYMLDDFLLVVMRGGLTTAEKTMLEFGQFDQVRQFRQLFANEMRDRLTDMVQRVTGRKVATHQSQVMFDPDLIVEMFVFDCTGQRDDRVATAEGLTQNASIGAATAEGALDAPSAPGR